MKRISIVVSAISAGLVILVASPVAARTKKPTPKPPAPTKVACTLSMSVQIPTGATAVTAGAVQGTYAGHAGCGAPLWSGVASSPFTIDASGDVNATFKEYLATGTLSGAYSLAITDQSPPTQTTFAATSYAGTVTVTGGSGVYRGVTGAGTLTCTTPDSIHLSCKEKLKLALPALRIAASLPTSKTTTSGTGK